MTAGENYITFSQNLLVLHSFSSEYIFVLAKLIIKIKGIAIIYNTIGMKSFQ